MKRPGFLRDDGTRWFIGRFGRRALVVSIGLAAYFVGLDLVVAEQSALRLESMRYLMLFVPAVWAWGVAWMVAGGVAVIGAFVPRTNDRWGLDALAFMYGLWSFELFAAGLGGTPTAFARAALHAALLAVVFISADMRRVNPDAQPH